MSKDKILSKIKFPIILVDTIFVINMYRATKFNLSYNTFLHTIALILINLGYFVLHDKFKNTNK